MKISLDLKNTIGFSLGFLGLILFILFFANTSGFLVAGNPYAFGFFEPKITFILPWIGVSFLLLLLAQYLTNSSTRRLDFQEKLGIVILLIAFLGNGFVSGEPLINIYMLGWLVLCMGSLFWNNFFLEKKWFYFLFFLGVVVAFFKFQEGEITADLPVLMSVLFFWKYRYISKPKEISTWVSSVVAILFVLALFKAYLLIGPILLLSFLDLYQRKKFFLRKAKLLGHALNISIVMGIVFWFIWGFKNHIFLGFGSMSQGFLGNGFAQNIHIFISQKNEITVFKSSDLAINGFAFLWSEWGILIFLLMLGNIFIWWSLFHKKIYSLLFLLGSVVFFVPGILTFPVAWILISFFTWNKGKSDK